MNSESQVLALHQTRQGAERLRELVATSPVAKLAGLESSPDEFEKKALKLQPQIMLVELAEGLNGYGDLLDRVRRAVPRGAVVAIAGSKEPEDIMAAMRLGVREYLVEPTPASAFNDAILRLARQSHFTGQPAGRLLAVIGVKGGVGASHLSLNLAWSYSRDPEGGNVTLVDLDLYSGDQAVLMDLDHKRDISDVAVNYDRMDAVLIDSLLTEAAPGMRLLAAPSDPVVAEEVKPEHVARALDHLLDSNSLVVLDLPSRMDEISLLALDRADAVLVVVEPTVVGLAGARRFLSLSSRLGHAPEKIHLIVNRDGAKGCLSQADVQRALGAKPMAFLPNDSRLILQAINSGCPALRDWPKAKWSRAVTQLGQELPLFEQPQEEAAA
jgi:pilus assembly protein CpaE